MRLRRAVLATLAVTLSLTTAASAAVAKPLCLLITDETGDGHSQSMGFLSSDALDIVSGDVATGKKTVVGVLRLKTTNVSSTDTAGYFGFVWNLNFEVGGTKYSFERRRTGTSGAYIDEFQVGTSTSAVKPTVKQDGTSITWTVPRSAVSNLKKPKQVLKSIRGGTKVFGGNADTADGVKTYPDLAKSCVKAA